MNRQRVVRAYEIISEGYAELAAAYANDQPAAGAEVPRPSPAPAATPEDIVRMTGGTVEPVAPIERVNDRAQSVTTWDHCPKHQKPFTDGNFGPYCASTSDEPQWANQKGYCKIKPSNAAAYARAHGMAA